MDNKIPLSKLQHKLMSEFYSIKKTKVILDKKERNKLWKKATSREKNIYFSKLNAICPALSHQIIKSYNSGKNIQAAVFSECIYSQTLANMLKLNEFYNCLEEDDVIPNNVKELLKTYSLFPRYIYTNKDKTKILVQAGGCNGIDCALITPENLNIYTIEFKEPSAKTSEPDLPKYNEDGMLKITDDFKDKYPQFIDMLSEHKTLNFFEVMGNNIHNFSIESINIAVTNNYTKKYADVICTEDINGYLVMLPVNQISLWSKIEGEIRPAGRNHYNVWTPKALRKFLENLNSSFKGNLVTIKKEKLALRTQRGGNKKISGYKITPLFFIYIDDCEDNGSSITFNIEKVQQLNPTIAGKIFFKSLKYQEVKEYYNL